MLRDLGLFIVRASVGSLIAGHGAQKLFGTFEGPGLEGTAGMMGSLGLEPRDQWALVAGIGEFGGGALTALGLCTPLGLLGVAGSMLTAATTAHGGKPVWVTSGGAELPLTNLAVVAAIALAGPGKFSLDELLGLRVPRWFSLLGLVAVGAVVAQLVLSTPPAAEPDDQAEAGAPPEPAA